MFSYLYYDIFPLLGEFFGKLAGVASMTLSDLFAVFNSTIGFAVINYKNLFTGNFNYFTLKSFGSVFNAVASALTRIVFAGLPLSTPLWVALLIAFVEVFLVASLIKFVKNFVSLL